MVQTQVWHTQVFFSLDLRHCERGEGQEAGAMAGLAGLRGEGRGELFLLLLMLTRGRGAKKMVGG